MRLITYPVLVRELPALADARRQLEVRVLPPLLEAVAVVLLARHLVPVAAPASPEAAELAAPGAVAALEGLVLLD